MGGLAAHQDEHFDVLAASDVVERLDHPGQPSVPVLDRLPRRSLRQQSLRDSRSRPAGDIKIANVQLHFLALALVDSRERNADLELTKNSLSPSHISDPKKACFNTVGLSVDLALHGLSQKAASCTEQFIGLRRERGRPYRLKNLDALVHMKKTSMPIMAA
jgi:hypothetical protein